MSETLYDYLNNEYFVGTLYLFIMIYISQLRLELPDWLISVFKNDIFRVIYLMLLLMIPFEKAPHVAFVVAFSFVLISRTILQKENQETLELFTAKKFKNLNKK